MLQHTSAESTKNDNSIDFNRCLYLVKFLHRIKKEYQH